MNRNVWIPIFALGVTAGLAHAAPRVRPPAGSPPPAQSPPVSPRGASQLLTTSAAALAQAKSYQFDGFATVSPQASGKSIPDLRYSQYGAFSRPGSYAKITLNPSGVQKSGAAEIYADGKGGVYLKTSGDINMAEGVDNEWVAVATSGPSTAGNPLSNIQMLTKGSGAISMGENESLNGINYVTVKASLNGEAARALMGSILAAAEKQVSSQGRAKGQTEVSVTYYINPKTSLAEVARYSGTESVTGIPPVAEVAAAPKPTPKPLYGPRRKPGEPPPTPAAAAEKPATPAPAPVQMTLQVNGDITLRDLNQPVSLPDVNGAVSMPKMPRKPQQ